MSIHNNYESKLVIEALDNNEEEIKNPVDSAVHGMVAAVSSHACPHCRRILNNGYCRYCEYDTLSTEMDYRDSGPCDHCFDNCVECELDESDIADITVHMILSK